MHITFIILGVLYSIGQIILIREFLVIFYGNEIIIGFVFASWLFWIALGSYLYARFSDRTKNPFLLFAILQFILPILLVLQVLGIWNVRFFLNVATAEIISLGSSMTMSFILTMPLSFSIGILFPLGCRIAGERSGKAVKSISAIYIFETLGSIVGGILFSLFFAGRFNHSTVILLLTVLIEGNLGVLILRSYRKEIATARIKTFGWLGIAVCAVSFICLITPLRKSISYVSDATRWRSYQPDLEFVESINSRYQNLAVGKLNQQYSILGDGKFISSFPEEIEHVQFSALLFAQKPDTKKILLIGGGFDGCLRELLVYPVESIDYVEQDPKLFSLVKKYLPSRDRDALEDSRVTIHFTDGRRFIQLLKTSPLYDLIIIKLPDPASAYLNRYYTLDFFRETERLLKEDGVLCTGALSAENYFGKDVATYNRSIYHTIKSVFPHVVVKPGERQLYYASKSAGIVTSDYSLLKKRYLTISSERRRFSPEGFRTLFPPERVGFVRNELEKAHADINMDIKPITYYFNMLLWSNFSGSEWVKALEHIRTGGIGVYILPVIIIILFRFLYVTKFPHPAKEKKFNAYISIWAAGFVAMGFQIILIFLYQSLFGFIYERIGIVTALFMLGLASGAGLVNAFIIKIKRPDGWIGGILISIALFLFSIPLFVMSQSMNELVFLLLFIISGFLTGCMFPLGVSLYYQSMPQVGETAGLIDSADHWGAMMGALISSALLVPLVGIHQSCYILAAFSLLTSLLVMYSFITRSKEEREVSFLSFPFWRTSWSMAVLVVALFSITTLIRAREKKVVPQLEDTMLSKISGSRYFEYKEIPFPHYRGLDDRKELESIVLSTQEVAGHIRGYGGPINLFLSVSREGKIHHVRLLESQETPAYIAGIGMWLEKFKNLDITRDFPLKEKRIDALTGATVTSDAIMRIINESVFRIDAEILNISGKRKKIVKENQVLVLFKDMRLYSMLILLVCSVWIYLFRGKIAKILIISLNLIFFGFFTNMLITLIHIGNFSIGNIPGLDNLLWLVFLSIVIIISVSWGQVFCGYICPFGALQELCSLFKLTRPPHPVVEQKARYLKYMILSFGLILFWISGTGAWLAFSPLNYVFSRNLSIFMMSFIIFILAASLFYVRFWCRYFCPAGAFFSFFNKISLFDSVAPPKDYARCDLGVKDKKDIDCIKCNRCRF